MWPFGAVTALKGQQREHTSPTPCSLLSRCPLSRIKLTASTCWTESSSGSAVLSYHIAQGTVMPVSINAILCSFAQAVLGLCYALQGRAWASSACRADRSAGEVAWRSISSSS